MVLITKQVIEKGIEYWSFGIENGVEIGSIISGRDIGNDILIDDLNLALFEDIFVSKHSMEEVDQDYLEKLMKDYDIVSGGDFCIITNKYYEKVSGKELLGNMHMHFVSEKLKPSPRDFRNCINYTCSGRLVLQMIYDLNGNFEVFGFKSFYLKDFMSREIVFDRGLDKWIEKNYDDLVLDVKIID